MYGKRCAVNVQHTPLTDCLLLATVELGNELQLSAGVEFQSRADQPVGQMQGFADPSPGASGREVTATPAHL